MTKMVKMNKIMKLHTHSKIIYLLKHFNLHSKQQDGHVIQNFYLFFKQIIFMISKLNHNPYLVD